MMRWALTATLFLASCDGASSQETQMSATVTVRNTDRVRVACRYSPATMSYHEADEARQAEDDPFTLYWDDNQQHVRIELSPERPSPCMVIFWPTGLEP